MKVSTTLVLAVALVGSSLLAATPQTSEPTAIAIINGDRVLEGSNIGRQARERLEAAAAVWEERVNAVSPDLLILGISPPKQELWISENYRHVAANVAICGGATIDFLAGAKRRAPVWMQKAGLEWTFRVCSEPRRLFARYWRDGLEFTRLLFVELFSRGRRSS